MATQILRVVTGGNVDDGKSTLLARLLLDTKSFPTDQVPEQVTADSLANLLDGLDWEREQGITIDVAHRYFEMSGIRYHLLDSPGHHQYTRNMATAASGADIMLLLVSATEGLKPQTLSHLKVAKLMGVKNFIIAINKLDQVKNRADRFRKIKLELRDEFNFDGSEVRFVGIVAITGENLVRTSRKLQFDDSKTLLETLAEFAKKIASPLNLMSHMSPMVSIQMVAREKDRVYLGKLIQGAVRKNDLLRVAGSNLECRVATLFASGIEVDSASANAEISFTLDEEVDLTRGDVLSSLPFSKSSIFMTQLIWLDSSSGFLNRRYILQVGHQNIACRITKVDASSDANGHLKNRQKDIPVNSILFAEIATNLPVSISTDENSFLNTFILIDPVSSQTIAAGRIMREQRRSLNLHEHAFSTDSTDVASRLGLKGTVVWLTGLSGSGKSTIADALAEKLDQSNKLFAILDGDSLRSGINKDLGFSDADRVENVRRTAEIAKLLAQSGVVVIVALVSPFAGDRKDAREIVGEGKFLEVFIDTPIEICERRDPKGLYKKARKGEIPNFTGIGSSYEVPSDPDIRIDTLRDTAEQAAMKIFSSILGG